MAHLIAFWLPLPVSIATATIPFTPSFLSHWFFCSHIPLPFPSKYLLQPSSFLCSFNEKKTKQNKPRNQKPYPVLLTFKYCFVLLRTREKDLSSSLLFFLFICLLWRTFMPLLLKNNAMQDNLLFFWISSVPPSTFRQKDFEVCMCLSCVLCFWFVFGVWATNRIANSQSSSI